MQSTIYFPELQWHSDDVTFTDTFRVLELASYDGIVGLDWLGKYSPMLTHWEQNWLSFQHEGRRVVLHGARQRQCTHALVELHSLHEVTEQQQQIPPVVQSILDQFSSVFEAPTGLPPCRRYDHHIPLILGARIVSIRSYRVTPELKNEIEQQIKELLKQGVITHINSLFGSPVLLVKKEEVEWRLVVDYRHLNSLIVKGKYPLPIIDELLDELTGACWFSKLYLKAGYHHIRLAPREEHKTAFQTHNGHYEFKVMAFGLTGAPATFQHAMNATLEPVLHKFDVVFFNDMLICSYSYEHHLDHLGQVLAILQHDKWQVKFSKCVFSQQKVAYLGHVVSADGVATDGSKIQSIQECRTPANQKELRRFLGLTGYYRKFIKHYAIIAQTLIALLRKGVIYTWMHDTESAFQVLKQALISAPVLALSDFSKQFVVDTDAYDVGIGAVLSQGGHPLAYVSRALGPRNRGLLVYDKEYLAILLAVEQ